VGGSNNSSEGAVLAWCRMYKPIKILYSSARRRFWTGLAGL
jgi:hypothetical protein